MVDSVGIRAERIQSAWIVASTDLDLNLLWEFGSGGDSALADSDSGRKGLAFIAASADLVPLWKFGSGGDTDSTEIRSASRRRGLSPRRWEGGGVLMEEAVVWYRWIGREEHTMEEAVVWFKK